MKEETKKRLGLVLLAVGFVVMLVMAVGDRRAVPPEPAPQTLATFLPAHGYPPLLRNVDPWTPPVLPSAQPPDPRVTKCAETTKTYVEAKACLDRAFAPPPAPKADAGAHVLAASPQPVPPVNTYWQATDFYIGPGGSHGASGLSSGAALLSCGDFYDRVGGDAFFGPNPPITNLITRIHILGAMADTTNDPCHFKLTAGRILQIFGTRSVAASGTMANVSALSKSVGDFWIVNMQQDMTSFGGGNTHLYVLDTTTNAIAGIQTTIPALGTGYITITNPLADSSWPSSGSIVTKPAATPFNNGDSWQILQFPTIQLGELNGQGGSIFELGDLQPTASFTVNGGIYTNHLGGSGTGAAIVSLDDASYTANKFFINSEVGSSSVLMNAWVIGGFVGANSSIGGTGLFDGDMSFQNHMYIMAGGRQYFGSFSTHHNINVLRGATFYPTSQGPFGASSYTGSETIWADNASRGVSGPQIGYCVGGALVYTGTATSGLIVGPGGAGAAMAMNENECLPTIGAYAIDPTKDLSIPLNRLNVAITPTTLSQSTISGGYGDFAQGLDHANLLVSSSKLTTIPTITPFIIDQNHGGTGLDGGCPDGSPYVGTGTATPPRCGSFPDASSATPSGAAGGDLGGTYPNPSVQALQGHALPGTYPSTGPVLDFSWSPGVGITYTPSVPNCIAGDVPLSSGSSTGYGCAVLPTVPGSLPPNGPAGGDLGGTYPNPSVQALQGHALPGTYPSVGPTLNFSWIPGIGIGYSESVPACPNGTVPLSNGTTYASCLTPPAPVYGENHGSCSLSSGACSALTSVTVSLGTTPTVVGAAVRIANGGSIRHAASFSIAGTTAGTVCTGNLTSVDEASLCNGTSCFVATFGSSCFGIDPVGTGSQTYTLGCTLDAPDPATACSGELAVFGRQ